MLLHAAVGGQARVRMVTLIGSTSTWFSARSSKPCQPSPGFSTQLGSVVDSAASCGIAVGLPDLEPPRDPCICFLDVRHGAAEAERLVDGLLHERRPPGCSIIAAATSQEAMMPYCGEVEVCIMKASLKRAMSSCSSSAVLDVDHRGLRQGGEQLVRRMRREGDRVRRARRVRRRDRVEAVVELVEVRVGVPGLVEVEHLDRVAERLLDRVDVVAEAVVGGVGHHHQADLAARLARRTGSRRSSCAIDSGVNWSLRDRPDDAEAVARRRQVDRRRARS